MKERRKLNVGQRQCREMFYNYERIDTIQEGNCDHSGQLVDSTYSNPIVVCDGAVVVAPGDIWLRLSSGSAEQRHSSSFLRQLVQGRSSEMWFFCKKKITR